MVSHYSTSPTQAQVRDFIIYHYLCLIETTNNPGTIKYCLGQLENFNNKN